MVVMGIMTRVRDIVSIVEKLAPQGLAASWDRIGLQVGDPDGVVRKIYVALDPSRPVIARAIASGCQLLLTHHPLCLTPPAELNFSSGLGGSIALALAHRLSIHAAHTNLDAADGGLNDVLCTRLGLLDTRPLISLSEMASKRPSPDPRLGLGRVGTLARSVALKAYIEILKHRFKARHFRLIASPTWFKRRITRVALCSGSGGSLIEAAAASGADLYITGDIKYHDALSALDLNLPVADLGHFATEHWVIDLLAQIVQKGLAGSKRRKILIIKDRASRDPFIFI